MITSNLLPGFPQQQGATSLSITSQPPAFMRMGASPLRRLKDRQNGSPGNPPKDPKVDLIKGTRDMWSFRQMANVSGKTLEICLGSTQLHFATIPLLGDYHLPALRAVCNVWRQDCTVAWCTNLGSCCRCSSMLLQEKCWFSCSLSVCSCYPWLQLRQK